MNINYIIKKFRKDILRITANHGAHNIKVFGSLVHRTAKKNSDVDLLIKLDTGRSLLDIIAIKQDLEDLLDCDVDVVTENALSPYIREKVIKEAVDL